MTKGRHFSDSLGDRWFTSSGGKQKKLQVNGALLNYTDYCRLALLPMSATDQENNPTAEEHIQGLKQIKADCESGRTDAACFDCTKEESIGKLIKVSQIERFGPDNYVEKARKQTSTVLQAYLQRNAKPGYVQGLNLITTVLLCNMSEENAFWTLCALVEDLRVADFYSSSVTHMQGFELDCEVLFQLAKQRIPKLFELLGANLLRMTIKLFSSKSLIPLFINVVSTDVLLYFFAIFFDGGGEASCLRLCFAIISLVADELLGPANEKTKITLNIKKFLKARKDKKHDQELRAVKADQASKDELGTYTMMLELAASITVDKLKHALDEKRVALDDLAALQVFRTERLRSSRQWTRDSDMLFSLQSYYKLTPAIAKQVASVFKQWYSDTPNSESLDDVDDSQFLNSGDERQVREGITLFQFGKLMRTMQVKQMGFFFSEEAVLNATSFFDFSRTKFIDINELIFFWTRWVQGSLCQRLAICFAIFNADNSGVLSLMQLSKLNDALLNAVVRLKKWVGNVEKTGAGAGAKRKLVKVIKKAKSKRNRGNHAFVALEGSEKDEEDGDVDDEDEEFQIGAPEGPNASVKAALHCMDFVKETSLPVLIKHSASVIDEVFQQARPAGSQNKITCRHWVSAARQTPLLCLLFGLAQQTPPPEITALCPNPSDADVHGVCSIDGSFHCDLALYLPDLLRDCCDPELPSDDVRIWRALVDIDWRRELKPKSCCVVQ